jgi:hypothetical protein
MVHLQEIARRISGKPQVFILRPGRLEPLAPGKQINAIALRENIPPNQLITRESAAMDDEIRRRG